MGKLFVMVLIVGLIASVGYGIEMWKEAPSTKETAEQNERAKAYAVDEANRVMQSIRYMKDSRTGLCFAYYWGGMSNGGPALANVPCQQVEAFIIK